jgi:transcription initiation factor TFIIIB Brf1 subunit/transcription initiation factor TFIIB
VRLEASKVAETACG